MLPGAHVLRALEVGDEGAGHLGALACLLVGSRAESSHETSCWGHRCSNADPMLVGIRSHGLVSLVSPAPNDVQNARLR